MYNIYEINYFKYIEAHFMQFYTMQKKIINKYDINQNNCNTQPNNNNT